MKGVIVFIVLIPILSFSQNTQQTHAARIQLNLKKLGVLTSVLYVAAHPDDENTRIIATMANDHLAATGYLSMTRGDGGQNLVGPEIGDKLGIIRTHELLTARNIDGGQQFFTRAIDFGFSKSAQETFAIWNKEEILKDVVHIIRKFQPDIIITRFPPDERAGHGHHTASAMLAHEAFTLAADPTIYPEQLQKTTTWQTKRLYTNTGRWWNNSISEKTPGVIAVNVGRFSSLLGESYSEIAARSRSQHKSQGFGSRGTRGDQLEYLEFAKGDSAVKDIFDGINTSWTRLKGGDKVKSLIDKANSIFNAENPEGLLPILIEIKKEMTKLEPGVWRSRKIMEVDQLIYDCLGLFIEVTADHYWSSPGYPVSFNFEVVNRSKADVVLEHVDATQGIAFDSSFTASLKSNKPLIFKSTKTVLPTTEYSGPDWLQIPHTIGIFTIVDPALEGKAGSDPPVIFNFKYKVNGEIITISKPSVYKWVDPVKGEQMRPFEIVPPVFVNLKEKVVVLNDDQPKEISVSVQSSVKGPLKGNVALKAEGWSVEPSMIPFDFQNRDEEQIKKFTVRPLSNSTHTLQAVATIDSKNFSHSIAIIQYDHIPTQVLLTEAKANVVRINVKKSVNNIGYVNGAGDDIPEALQRMGYKVWQMKNEEVNADNLQKMDAIVLGIRALNTNKEIDLLMNTLLDYVKAGGTLVMQYNTSFGMSAEKFSPYDLTLSRARVTEEDATVRILKPDHTVLNYPNKIYPSDFEGWVQERGLYFPDKWGNEFEAILSMNDKGETPLDGGLLIAKYGKGYYVYTALSFFRQLPEGIPGAYKLLANITSLKANEAAPVKQKSTKSIKSRTHAPH